MLVFRWQHNSNCCRDCWRITRISRCHFNRPLLSTLKRKTIVHGGKRCSSATIAVYRSLVIYHNFWMEFSDFRGGFFFSLSVISSHYLLLYLHRPFWSSRVSIMPTVGLPPRWPWYSTLRVVVFGAGVLGQAKAGTAGPGGRPARSPDLQRRPRCWRPRRRWQRPHRPRSRPATNSTRNHCWRCRGRTPSTERRPATTWVPNGTRTCPNRRPTQRLITVYS